MDKKIIIIIILICIIGGLTIYKRKPVTSIETKTVTKTETKVVSKNVYITKYVKIHDHIITTKTLDITAKDGTKTHEVINQTNTSLVEQTTDKTKNTSLTSTSTSKEVDKKIEKYGSIWAFGVSYNNNYGIPVAFDYKKTNALVEYSVFGPLSLIGSVSGDFKTQSIGIIFHL